MSFSQVQIINLALGKLRAGTINSLEEKSVPAETATLYWPLALDAVLSMHPWNFAAKTVALALVGPSDRQDWVYKYSQPSDCVVVRKIITADRNAALIEFIVQSGHIYTDTEQVQIEYTARPAEPGLIPAYFVEALTWQLAVQMADALSGDLTRRQQCATMYENTLSAARRVDAGEGAREAVIDPAWIRARFA